jgi:uncharacterized protein YcfJ
MKKVLIFTTTLFVTFAVSAQADVSAKITDHYKTVENRTPHYVDVCNDVNVSGDRSGDMLRGAIIGGIIGNNVTKNLPDGGTAGAIIGGLFGHSNSTATGGTQRQCHTETRYTTSSSRVYDYSLMSFYYNGKYQRVKFRKN